MINLMLGDCLERMKEIEFGSVDMILTDPPYGTTACKWDSIIPLEPMWEQLKRVIKPDGAIVMTANQPFTTTLIASNMKMFKYCWVWDKNQATGFLNAWKQPLKRVEDVCVFYSKQCTYNPQITDKKPENIRTGRSIKTDALTDSYGKYKNDKSYRTLPHDKTMPVNLININRVNSSKGKVHPTQKPVTLMEYLIKTYTNESETVLDFTMGSGSTGVAAKNLSRKFIGIEMDEGYFNIAKKRIDEA